MCTAAADIRQRQKNFLQKIVKCDSYPGSYLEKVIQLSIAKKSPAGLVLKELLDNSCSDYRATCMIHLKTKLQSSTSSRREAYRLLNPALDASPIYSDDQFIPEQHRIAFTRLRTGSHKLRIETGRWARLPRELRTCPCGDVQDEEHVLTK